MSAPAIRTLLSGLCAAALLGTALPAAAMSAVQKVEREILVTLDDGRQVTRREPADLVKPGERVVYTLDYINTEAEAASDLVLDMPVPDEVQFMDGTAERSGTVVTFSADRGQSFHPRGLVTVPLADGTPRPASAGEITHVRWTLQNPVAPGETGEVGFKARLR